MSEFTQSSYNEVINSKEIKFLKSSNEVYVGNSAYGSNKNSSEVIFTKFQINSRSNENHQNIRFINEIETDGGFNSRLDKYKDGILLQKTIDQTQSKDKAKSNKINKH